MPVYTYQGEQASITIGQVRLVKGVAVEIDDDLSQFSIMKHLIKVGDLKVEKMTDGADNKSKKTKKTPDDKLPDGKSLETKQDGEPKDGEPKDGESDDGEPKENEQQGEQTT